ncbi:hypothetical protein COOONC_22766 [Cooperia oncophora]
MILVQYVVALAAFTHILGSKIIYTQNDDGSFTYVGLETGASWRNRIIYFGGSLIYALLSLVLNARLSIEWRKLTKFGGSSRNTGYEKVRVALLVYTALVFISTMLMCAQQISKAIASLTKNAEFDLWATVPVLDYLPSEIFFAAKRASYGKCGTGFYIPIKTMSSRGPGRFYWINDVMMCVPPFCLVVLSSDLRKDIINFARCRRHRNGHHAAVSVFNRQSTVGKY